MSEFATTDPDAIRDKLGDAIVSIVPSYAARRAERFVWARDQEIAGGSQFRLFDVQLGAEEEVIGAGQFGAGGWYGGGVQYGCEVEIRVSYPVGTPDAVRFAGADGRDLAAMLVELHSEVPGMFPISVDGPSPVLSRPEIEGDSGRHVAVFRSIVTFFASDEVERD